MSEEERIAALAALIREANVYRDAGPEAIAKALVAKGVRLADEYDDHYQDGFNDGIDWDR